MYNKYENGGDTAAVRRAMREKGYDPGKELRMPSRAFLEEKGMSQDEFMDSVYDRARDLRVRPIKSRQAGPIRYQQGGEVQGNGSSIKIPGQYAYEPIATTESGEQYVTMELPDGTMATVFGDWETYGNPNQQGYIEDLDYRIIPRGDGSYDLDAGEMESEMLRDEARGFARDTQGGPGATRMQDLLEKLSDRPGMGFTPEGRMRPVKRR